MKVNSTNQKKLWNIAISASLATSAAVSIAPTANAQSIFNDVKENSQYFEAVNSLHARGIVEGYNAGEFRPNEKATRAQAAKVIALALNLELSSVKDPGFKDVSKGNWAYKYIAALENLGVVDGFGDHFKPNETITRAQMSKMITLAFNLKRENTTSPFTDVKASNWYSEYVLPLVNYKITKGTTPTTFSPNNELTRGQMALFIYRSENAVQGTTSSIISIENNKLVTTSGSYAYSTEMAKWLTKENEAALKDATITFTSDKGTITEISSITLNANGVSSSDKSGHVIFNGNQAQINSDIIVNGDYVTVKNATINGDLIIGGAVQNAFYSDSLTIKGKTIINNETSNLFKVAQSLTPSVIFNNTVMGEVQVTKTNIKLQHLGSTTIGTMTINTNATLTSDANVKIPKLFIQEGASNVVIDSNVGSLEIRSKNELKVSGKGNFENILVATKALVSLVTEGTIANLKSSEADAKINLGKNTKVTDFTPPPGKKAEDVIKNFDEVKGNVSKVNGTTNNNGNTGGSNGNPSKNFELTIMHTNDTHANLDNAAKRVTAVKEVRTQKPNALLVDAGDVFSGTLYFNEFRGQADLALMNMMDYDVMTFGNHEFDLGSSSDGHQALVNFIKDAKFSFVSSNVDFSKDEKFNGLYSVAEVSENPEDGHIYNAVIKEVNGEKIGILGLTTEETSDISSPGSVEFQNYITEAQKAVDAFEAQGINKIVAVTHIGFDDNPEYDNDQELAKRVDGIDIIVGGHSHSFFGTDSRNAATYQPVVDTTGDEPTIIVSAYQYNTYLGQLDVEFNKAGEVVKHNGKLIDIASKAEDAEAVKELKPFKDQVNATKNTPTGATAAIELVQSRGGQAVVRKEETNLGNLITDGMLAKAKQYNPNTVIALQNGGGIRATIPAGDITVGELITTLPFGNTLATMNLKGSEIIDTLEHSVSVAPGLSGGFLQVSGMKYIYDSSQPVGQRVVSVHVKDDQGNYNALNENATYVVATNAFTAKGGDGYDMLAAAYAEGRVTDLGLTDWEVFMEHVKNLGTVNPVVEERIKDIAPVTVNATSFSGTAAQPKVYNGNVIVTISGTEDVTLQHAVVKGNLIIKGGQGIVTLENVTVEGDTEFLD